MKPFLNGLTMPLMITGRIWTYKALKWNLPKFADAIFSYSKACRLWTPFRYSDSWWECVATNGLWTRSYKHKMKNNVKLPVWPDCSIYWTLGNFSKPLATFNLQKSTFIGNFCKGVKIFNFSSEIIFGQLL